MRKYQKIIIISLLSVVLQPLQPFSAKKIIFSRPDHIAYRPILDRDGYLQAWNLSFRGNGYFIVLTYLISNIGPGKLNNGVSFFLHHNGVSRTGVAEYSRKSLKADRGKLNIKIGEKNYLLYRNGNYECAMSINETNVKLNFTHLQTGVALSGGKVRLAASQSDFMQMDIPVAGAKVTGILNIDGKRILLQGSGGIEHFVTNRLLHEYASRFIITRTMSAKNRLLLGGFKTVSDFAPRNRFTAVFLHKGRMIKKGIIRRVETFKHFHDSSSNYTIPMKTIYHLEGADLCKIMVEHTGRLGLFNVLERVSPLLRWVINVFFARPFVLHFQSKVTLECETNIYHERFSRKDVKENVRKITMKGQSSYYLIREADH